MQPSEALQSKENRFGDEKDATLATETMALGLVF
jgi:hypothetical protein